MSPTLDEKASLLERSTTVKCLRWFFRPRTLGLIAFVLITLATLVALFYLVEYWRGRRAWQAYLAEATRQGQRVDWQAYVPPPVPNDQNFAQTPLLAPMYDLFTGTQKWRDTNAAFTLQRIRTQLDNDAKDRGYRLEPGVNGSWQRGRRTDLREAFPLDRRAAQRAETNPAVAIFVPTNQVQAAQRLLELIEPHYAAALDELRLASQRPHARFNIQYDSPFVPNILLPHLAPLKGLVQILNSRAHVDLVLGKTDQAFQDLQLAFYLSDTIKNEPFLISYLVRLACRHIVIQTLADGLTDHLWTDSQLVQFQKVLGRDNLMHECLQSFLAEKAFGVRVAEQLRTTKDPSVLGSFFDEETRMGFFEPVRYFPKGWYYQEQVTLGRLSDAFHEPIRNWLEGKLDTAATLTALGKAEADLSDENTPWQRIRRHDLLARMLLPALNRAFEKSLRHQVSHDLAQVACALERHYLALGQYPEKLDELTPRFAEASLPADAFSRQPLRYQREDPKAYRLYSVGANLEDDNGQVVIRPRDTIDYTKGDILWQMPLE